MSLGFSVLRFVVGGIFAVHGYPKLFGGQGKTVSPEVEKYLGKGFTQAMESGPEGFVEMLRTLEVPEPEMMAKVVGATEFLGGIALATGVFARPAALALATDMVVAVKKVHWRNGLLGQGGYELPLTLLAACLAILLGTNGKRKTGEY